MLLIDVLKVKPEDLENIRFISITCTLFINAGVAFISVQVHRMEDWLF